MEPHSFSMEQLGQIHEPKVFISLPFFWPAVIPMNFKILEDCNSYVTKIFLCVSVAVYRVELPLKVFLNIQRGFISYEI